MRIPFLKSNVIKLYVSLVYILMPSDITHMFADDVPDN